jgi:hypothetical protein
MQPHSKVKVLEANRLRSCFVQNKPRRLALMTAGLSSYMMLYPSNDGISVMTMAGQTSSSASIKGNTCYIQGKTQSGSNCSMQGKVSQPTLREPDSQLTKKNIYNPWKRNHQRFQKFCSHVRSEELRGF